MSEDDLKALKSARDALKDAANSLAWSARRMQDACCSAADVAATNLAAGKAANASAALKEKT